MAQASLKFAREIPLLSIVASSGIKAEATYFEEFVWFELFIGRYEEKKALVILPKTIFTYLNFDFLVVEKS